MMGLPLGHVTQVPGISRAQQLKAIGNGVCPPQAIAAYTSLLQGLDISDPEPEDHRLRVSILDPQMNELWSGTVPDPAAIAKALGLDWIPESIEFTTEGISE